MSEKMREQFEAWHLDRYCGGLERLRKCVNAEDVYYYSETQTRWVSWQTSREAVVVELPKDIKTMGGDVMWSADVRAAIEAQGLKVAP